MKEALVACCLTNSVHACRRNGVNFVVDHHVLQTTVAVVVCSAQIGEKGGVDAPHGVGQTAPGIDTSLHANPIGYPEHLRRRPDGSHAFGREPHVRNWTAKLEDSVSLTQLDRWLVSANPTCLPHMLLDGESSE